MLKSVLLISSYLDFRKWRSLSLITTLSNILKNMHQKEIILKYLI